MRILYLLLWHNDTISESPHYLARERHGSTRCFEERAGIVGGRPHTAGTSRGGVRGYALVAAWAGRRIRGGVTAPQSRGRCA